MCSSNWILRVSSGSRSINSLTPDTCQGDGEVCGTAVEYPSTTTIRVDLIKGWTLEWPRLEREDFIMAIGSARPLEDATRIAYRELVLWMEAGIWLQPL